MKLSATHVFNCIVLRVKFGLTNCENIPPLLPYVYIAILLHTSLLLLAIYGYTAFYTLPKLL